MNEFDQHDKQVRKSLGRILWSTPLFILFALAGFKTISITTQYQVPNIGHYIGAFIIPAVFGKIMIHNMWIFNREKKKRDSQPVV